MDKKPIEEWEKILCDAVKKIPTSVSEEEVIKLVKSILLLKRKYVREIIKNTKQDSIDSVISKNTVDDDA